MLAKKRMTRPSLFGTMLWLVRNMLIRTPFWRGPMVSFTRRRKYGGRFNSIWQPWHEDLSFLSSVAPSFITWNTRALLHHLPSTRKIKCARLAEMIRPHAMIALQETHGTEEE
eukprot:6334143-Pyramimonas_sp.AAC.1